MPPEELKYAESHEWVRVEGDLATIGITDFAVEHLSDLVFIDLPDVGDAATAGQSFGEVESVKAVADLGSPVSGEIVEVNAALADQLETMATDPFGAGWMIKVRMTDTAELDRLLDAAAYKAACDADE